MRSVIVESTKTLSALIAALLLGIVVSIVAGIAIGLYVELPTTMSIAVWLPAVLCGVAAFLMAVWRFLTGESPGDLYQSAKDAWKQLDF